MNTNKTLIQKADLALADLISDGGYLQEEQAKKFIQSLIVESKLLSQVTVRSMKSHTTNIDKAKFGSRIMRDSASCTALSAGDRAKPDLEQVQIVSQLVKAEVRLCDEVMEDNIEGPNFQKTIMDMMAPRISADLEELLIEGDTASGDAYLANFDGALKSATSNVVDALSAGISQTLLRSTLKKLPSEYKKDKSKLRFLASVNAEEDYRDSLSSRDTVAGDRALLENAPVMYNGVPLTVVPKMPEGLGGTFDESAVLLTDPKNLHWGIWRKLKMETDRDVPAGVTIIVVSMRVGFAYAEEKAVVKLENVKVG